MTTPTIFALVPYDDGSGPRLKVQSGMQMSDGEKTVRLFGVGEDILVHLDDVDTLISGLRAAQKFYRDGNDEEDAS